MKKVLLAFALLLIVVGGVFITQNYLNGSKLSFFKKSSTVIIGDRKFEVSVADSQKEREIGLSETKSLSQDQGMVFLFEKPGFYSFWMKDMKFPIDIIYINDNKIVTIQNNVQPVKEQESPIVYTSTEPSNRVLEINAGLARAYNFKKGDKIKIENF